MPQSHSAKRRAVAPAFELVQRQVDRGEVPFVVLGVADAAGTIRLEAMTSPDGPRVGTDAVCLLASITKPIVATAVMTQVDAGAITLAEPLRDWAPGLVNPAWAPVNAWHVLSHTSAIDDVDLEAVIRGGGGRAELLAALRAVPQETPPGTRYHYASAPFDLLAEAVATRVGEPFDALLRRTVLDPLGMSSTAFDPRDIDGLASRAAPVAIGGLEGHGFHEDPLLVAGYTSLRLAGGGLWSTAPDLLRFGRAMLRGGELDGVRVLSPATVALMTREVTADRRTTWGGLGWQPDPMLADHYALGWGRPRAETAGSDRAFGHGGVSGTRLWIDPDLDLIYVYLTGCWGMPTTPIDTVAQTLVAALSS